MIPQRMAFDVVLSSQVLPNEAKFVYWRGILSGRSTGVASSINDISDTLLLEAARHSPGKSQFGMEIPLETVGSRVCFDDLHRTSLKNSVKGRRCTVCFGERFECRPALSFSSCGSLPYFAQMS
jgi:hypothetical protein